MRAMNNSTRLILFGLIFGIGAIFFVPPRANAEPARDAPVYIVQSGDTLVSIAARFNTTVAILKKLNNLVNDDLIQVGQKLILPANENSSTAINATAYIVQPGDTLQRIALRYGTTLRALQQLNDLPNPNLLTPGFAIAIPNAPALVKPGLQIDALEALQGGTTVVKIARPELTTVTGMLNGKPLKFTRAGGYAFALLGASRCAKIGAQPLTIVASDARGQPTTDNVTINITTTAYLVNAITLPPTGVSILQDSALIKRESDELASIVAKFSPTRLWRGAFRQPVYTAITENFGTRRSYNGGPVGVCGHEGTDFSMKLGDPVFAAARGRVAFSALTQVRGNLVVIDHGLGVFTGYYHLSALSVQAGQMVNPGDVIGKAGSTGLSTGPHLHWSMWINGEYVDPMEWTRRVIP